MRFLLAMSLVALIGCTTTKKTSDVPLCSSLVKKFYERVESDNLVFVLPYITKDVMIFIGANPEDTREAKVLCFLTQRFPRERSGCAQIGDVIGECNLGGDFGNVWYGEAEVNSASPEPLD